VIHFSDDRKPTKDAVIDLYRSVGWSSADKPDALHNGLLASHSLVTAWDADALVGLGNAISDGHLVVYFPHMVVRPDHQGRGIGTELMTRMMARYRGFHQQALIADGRAIDFYKKLGFVRAGATEPLWIFDGREHD
jgi:GNAT superfamily N-acetyltransferase